MKRTICCDLDDTLCSWGDEPLPGAKEALTHFREKGCRIIIATARLDPNLWGDALPQRIEAIKQWFNKYDMPYDEIVAHKPVADIYIDDRGYHFNGNWEEAKDQVSRILRI